MFLISLTWSSGGQAEKQRYLGPLFIFAYGYLDLRANTPYNKKKGGPDGQGGIFLRLFFPS